MNQVEVISRAKINLSLDVRDKRPDGYHNISSVMQSIALADRMIIRKKSGSFELKTNIRALPTDSRNLISKAISAICDHAKIPAAVSINLHKNIPIGAGLAGGSANAAGALLGMNRLFDLGLPDSDLNQIALEIGSDVPFCLSGGTWLAEGRGEILTKIQNQVYTRIVLYKPPFSVSTASVYQKFDPTSTFHRPNNEKLIDALQAGSLQEAFVFMGNALEAVTFKQWPILEKYQGILLGAGADFVLMSGSGPSLMAFFTEPIHKDSILRAAAALPGKAFLTEFVTSGQKLIIS